MSHDSNSRSRVPPEDPKAPGLSDEARRQIGRKLRLLYDEVESEPIPDRFVDLLRALADKESKPT